jgi:hypothetical protein
MNYRPMKYEGRTQLPPYEVRTTDLWGTELPPYGVHRNSRKPHPD